MDTDTGSDTDRIPQIEVVSRLRVDLQVKDYTETKGKNSVAPNLELTK